MPFDQRFHLQHILDELAFAIFLERLYFSLIRKITETKHFLNIRIFKKSSPRNVDNWHYSEPQKNLANQENVKKCQKVTNSIHEQRCLMDKKSHSTFTTCWQVAEATKNACKVTRYMINFEVWLLKILIFDCELVSWGLKNRVKKSLKVYNQLTGDRSDKKCM